MAVKISTTVDDDITRKIEDWVKIKQNLEKATADLAVKIKVIQDEFNKAHEPELNKIKDYEPEILDFIKKLPIKMVQVDDIVVEYKKVAGRASYSYQTLWESAFDKCTEEAKKTLLELKESIKKIGIGSESLILKKVEGKIVNWVLEKLKTILLVIKEISFRIGRRYSNLDNTINDLQKVTLLITSATIAYGSVRGVAGSTRDIIKSIKKESKMGLLTRLLEGDSKSYSSWTDKEIHNSAVNIVKRIVSQDIFDDMDPKTVNRVAYEILLIKYPSYKNVSKNSHITDHTKALETYEELINLDEFKKVPSNHKDNTIGYVLSNVNEGESINSALADAKKYGKY